ncbi:DUF4404 domain-containing protein [Kangiella spongicola]|uniref:DUF4404 domain-containing protein n=2 Tax=Kangiella spongicola TaxID=796379 RepID=A0A318D0W0_9GAMM|nr:DUF4404 domain-containing protein [Kangiella spongicola]
MNFMCLSLRMGNKMFQRYQFMSNSELTKTQIVEKANDLLLLIENQKEFTKEETLTLAKLELIIESRLFQQDAEEKPEEYLIERFQERLYNFEREYPSLSSFIRRISNSLSNIGI